MRNIFATSPFLKPLRYLFFGLAVSLFSPLFSAPVEKESETVVVLGGGIGSLTSALYLARSGLHPLVIEGSIPGGLLTQSHSVQNWPGEIEIEGESLMKKVRSQAEANGVRFLEEEVIEVDFSKRPFVLTTRSLGSPSKTGQILADSCIIGMGTTPNFLGIPGEKTYWGRGVTNCAICDGSLYRGQIVGVVGGGDAAILEAFYLSNIAKEVHLFVRKEQLRANESSRIKGLMERPNVTVHYNTEVVEVKGDGKGVKSLLLKSGQAPLSEFPLDGLFLAIGSRPNTQLFQKALKLDRKGYISLKKDQETSVLGVYAVGDIVDPVYKQAISAAGDGAKAALQSQQFLMEKSVLVRSSSKISAERKVSDVSTAEKSNRVTGLKKEKKQASDANSDVLEIVSVQQFEQILKTAGSPVVVDFYATWCGPCKRLSPLFESSAARLVGKVIFLKVNVDQVGELSRSYKIQAMPTALLFDASGKEIERKTGTEQIAGLLEQLDSQVPTHSN